MCKQQKSLVEPKNYRERVCIVLENLFCITSQLELIQKLGKEPKKGSSTLKSIGFF